MVRGLEPDHIHVDLAVQRHNVPVACMNAGLVQWLNYSSGSLRSVTLFERLISSSCSY